MCGNLYSSTCVVVRLCNCTVLLYCTPLYLYCTSPQHQEDSVNVDAFESKVKQLRQVIRKMIKSDGTVIELIGQEEDGIVAANRLRIHPNELSTRGL